MLVFKQMFTFLKLAVPLAKLYKESYNELHVCKTLIHVCSGAPVQPNVKILGTILDNF
jgi:hypothetical protein